MWMIWFSFRMSVWWHCAADVGFDQLQPGWEPKNDSRCVMVATVCLEDERTLSAPCEQAILRRGQDTRD